MIYDKHIDKTEEALRELREIYSNDDVNRFIDGLKAGKICNEQDIQKFINYVRNSDGLTQLEYTRLKQLVNEGFIEKFATNYNKSYSTCQMLMSKMKSSVSRGLDMLGRMCEKGRSRKGSHHNKYNVVSSSKIGKAAYTKSTWGLELYGDSVITLYNEIRMYKKHLMECIDLCLNVLKSVEYVKTHPEDAYDKHQKNREKVLLNNRTVIKRLISMGVDMENELMDKVEDWKQKKKSIEEISAMLYHTLDENEYNDWVISEEVMAARRDGITNQERAIWGDNKKQVMMCRIVYQHIDELQPEGQKDHIGGEFLAMLYKWSNTKPNHGMEYWLTYFTDFYKKSDGKLTPVKKGAVKRCLSMITTEKITKQTVEDFNKRMDNLVEKYMISTDKDDKNIKLAANF